MKNIKKSKSNFQHYGKKIEAQAEKWFSYKKTCNNPSRFGAIQLLCSHLGGWGGGSNKMRTYPNSGRGVSHKCERSLISF